MVGSFNKINSVHEHFFLENETFEKTGQGKQVDIAILINKGKWRASLLCFSSHHIEWKIYSKNQLNKLRSLWWHEKKFHENKNKSERRIEMCVFFCEWINFRSKFTDIENFAFFLQFNTSLHSHKTISIKLIGNQYLMYVTKPFVQYYQWKFWTMLCYTYI